MNNVLDSDLYELSVEQLRREVQKLRDAIWLFEGINPLGAVVALRSLAHYQA